MKATKSRKRKTPRIAAQLAAVHASMMIFVRKLNNSEGPLHQDSAERAVNKLARTSAILIETLKRYRTGGEQKVTVQHVSVSEGGQAIVGHFNQHSSGNKAKYAGSPPRALTDAKTVPMQTIEESKEPVSVSTRKARQK